MLEVSMVDLKLLNLVIPVMFSRWNISYSVDLEVVKECPFPQKYSKA